MFAFYIQTSTLPYSLRSQTKAYLCKLLGNLAPSLQHIGACLGFTWNPVLSNSRLQHLCLSTACLCHPSHGSASPQLTASSIKIPAAGILSLTCEYIVWENAASFCVILVISCLGLPFFWVFFKDCMKFLILERHFLRAALHTTICYN